MDVIEEGQLKLTFCTLKNTHEEIRNINKVADIPLLEHNGPLY